MSQNLSVAHYGERQSFNRYFNRLAATALYVASLLVVIAGVLITESNISDALEYEKSIVLLAKEEKNYKDLYAKKFKDFEEVFQNAGVMNSAVELAEQIKINSSTSPLDFLISLSNIISQQQVGTVHIDKIEWQASSENKKNNKAGKANFTAKLPVKHSAIVTGRIAQPEQNYRESIEQIQVIIHSLKSNPRIETAEVIKMPVDLRSESKFSTESGVEIKQGINGEVSGGFSLKITMKAPSHV